MVKACIPIILFLCYQFIPGMQIFLSASFQFLYACDFYGLRMYLLSYGVMAPVASIFLMVLQSTVPFVPGVAITLANAWLFGWFLGSIYSGIGALLGAVLDFYIARWYGKSCFSYVAGEKFVDAFNRYVVKHGALSVLVARLIPVVPFKVISYSAGLSDINVKTFTVFTFFGQMPAIVLYSLLGQNIHDNLPLLFLITGCFCILAIFLFKRKRK